MTRFIILQDDSDLWERSNPPAPTPISRKPDAEGVAKPVVTAGDYTPAELRDVLADPRVLACARVMPTRLTTPQPLDDVRNDDLTPGWGLTAVGADRSTASGQGVKVALLDTGIETAHPAFDGVSIVAKDFAGSGIEDANGHGTHIAGTVLGRDLEGARIGVARGVTDLVLAKALRDDGYGTSEDFMNALHWAIGQDADIIGFSLSYDVTDMIETLQSTGYPMTLAQAAAFQAFHANIAFCARLLRIVQYNGGPLVIAAVGNDSLRMVSPEMETGPSAPAGAHGILSVGALGPGEQGLQTAAFSNTDPTFSAPGVGIISAGIGGGVRSYNGSSMAMAHAVGTAALWGEVLNTTTNPCRDLRRLVIENCTRTGLAPGTSEHDCGLGILRAPSD